MRSTKKRSGARTVLVASGLLAAVAVAGCTGVTGTAAVGPATPSAAAPASPSVAAAAPPVTTVAPPPAATTAQVQATRSRKPAAVRTPECTSAGLAVTVAYGDSAMSHTGWNLRFTNVGTKPCVIVGFPGVSYVAGDKGIQVGAAAEREGKIGPQLTLAPGHTAYSLVIGTVAAVFDPPVCRPTPVRGFRVYPPDQTAAKFVPLPAGVQGCAGNPPSAQLEVRTIQPGTGLS